MKFDTSLSPEDFFFVPGHDPGMSYVAQPDWIMRRVAGARILQVAASDYPTVQTLIEGRLHERFTGAGKNITFEINSVPVVLQQAVHRGSYASTRGKWIMNAAAGDRIIEKYISTNGSPMAEQQVNRLFAAARDSDPATIPVWRRRIRKLDVVIECRNQYNFYHFLTEALGNLSLFAGMRHRPQVTFQCRKGELRAFPMRFVQALYPEFAERVQFVEKPVVSERVLAPYSHRHYLYQTNDPRSASEIAAAASQDEWWGNVGAHRPRRKFVFRNSFDSSLRLLRERALSIVNANDIAARPNRIIVVRDPDRGARDREMEGAAAMSAALAPLGFVEVCFERMTPLEQIATVQAADVIIAEHGAALAHMTFARPDAHVIEIGTAQTQAHRWGDFACNAHVSGCAYTTIFADLSGEDPETIPKIVELHRGIRIGKRALDAVVELAEQAV